MAAAAKQAISRPRMGRNSLVMGVASSAYCPPQMPSLFLRACCIASSISPYLYLGLLKLLLRLGHHHSRANHLHSDVEDPDLRIVGEDHPHHLAVGRAALEAQARILVEEQLRHELRRRISSGSGSWELDPGQAHVISAGAIVEGDEVGALDRRDPAVERVACRRSDVRWNRKDCEERRCCERQRTAEYRCHGAPPSGCACLTRQAFPNSAKAHQLRLVGRRAPQAASAIRAATCRSVARPDFGVGTQARDRSRFREGFG